MSDKKAQEAQRGDPELWDTKGWDEKEAAEKELPEEERDKLHKEKRKVVRHSAELWGKIKAEYAAGITITELAKKYPPTASAISKRAARERWGECGKLITQKEYKKGRQQIIAEHNRFLKEAMENATFQHVQQYRNAQSIIHKMLVIVNKGLDGRKQKLGKEPYHIQALVNSLSVCINGERSALGLKDGDGSAKESTPLENFANTLAEDRADAGIKEEPVGLPDDFAEESKGEGGEE